MSRQIDLFEVLHDERQESYMTKEDEMIEKMLFKGSGFKNGKKRIYEFAITNPTKKDFANFLKNEYGEGGFGSPLREPYYIHSDSHDAKGIKFKYSDNEGNEIEQSISWTKAAEVISEMVKRGAYQCQT